MVAVKAALAALLALGLAQARVLLPASRSASSSFTPPDFYHDKVGPVFKNTTGKGDKYETRVYEKTAWAAYDTSDGFVVSEGKAYTQLTRYFKGANAEDAHLDLTTPVGTIFQPSEDFSSSANNYTVLFFLQDKIPEPEVDGVYIRKLGKSTTYSRSFGGYATEASILDEAKALRADLKADKVILVSEDFVFSTYDTPARFLNRHNEVSFISKLPHPLAAAEEALPSPAAARAFLSALYQKLRAYLN